MIDYSSELSIHAVLYKHQLEAVNFACNRFIPNTGEMGSPGVAFLMEMGCGKSLSAISVIGILAQRGLIQKVLIVAPLSIVGVWEHEFSKFAGFPYTMTIIKGSATKKAQLLQSVLIKNELQIIVVNYESARCLEKHFISLKPDMVVADEGHRIKDHAAKQAKTMHKIGDIAKYKLLLTGTVITNKEIDVFSQYRFLNPEIFGTSFYLFRNRYFYMTGYGNHTPVFRQERGNEFLEKVHSIAFRTTKAECLDLPPVFEEVRRIKLENKAMSVYKKMEKDCLVDLGSSEVTALNILTKLLRLSQITGGHLTDDEKNSYTVSGAKLDALNDIIDSAVSENQKLVVMARFIPEIKDIKVLLEKKRIRYAQISGEISDRHKEILNFQEDKDCMVFIGQIAAAGLGITLTAASTMVFYSLDYSMSNFEQAKARIHRVSQSRKCQYIYLLAENTVDEKVYSALQNKKDLATALIDDYRSGHNPFKQEEQYEQQHF